MFLRFLLSRRPMALIDMALSDAIVYLLRGGDGGPTSPHLSVLHLSSSTSSSLSSQSL